MVINMFQLTIVLVESSLELVPPSIRNHPAIRKPARRMKKDIKCILLDRSLHHSAMKKLDNAEKRGRPDIVHFSSLLILDSPLNKEGLLKYYIHTIDNKIISIDPATRLPKNDNRFIGLMEQLLCGGKVPPDSDKPLLKIEDKNLEELIEDENPSEVILLSERGQEISTRDLSTIITKLEKPLVMIGGFPHGDFDERIYNLSTSVYSLYKGRTLESWTVVALVISSIAQTLGII